MPANFHQVMGIAAGIISFAALTLYGISKIPLFPIKSDLV